MFSLRLVSTPGQDRLVTPYDDIHFEAVMPSRGHRDNSTKKPQFHPLYLGHDTQQIVNCPSHTHKMSLLILPNELLLQIAESLPSEKDINALVRTNRLFHTLLNPYLYRHNILHHASDALVRAAELGSASATAKLLAAGANVNVKDRSGHPLLVKAAGMGRVEVVKVLVEHPGIDLNARGAGAGFSALNAALKHGRVDVAEVLIGTEGVDLVSRTNNERAPLSYAAMLPGSEGERTVRMLLDTGKVEVFTWDILSCTPWIIAAAKGNMGSLELLLEEVRKEISWEADDDGRPPWALDHTNNLDSIVEGLGAGISGMRLLWSLDMRTQLRDVFMSDRIPMPYSPEFYAPANIYLRPGNTLVPSRWMSTFQCAGIPTKIQRGTIVIPNEVHVSESGDKLGSSSFLFNILNVSTTV